MIPSVERAAEPLDPGAAIDRRHDVRLFGLFRVRDPDGADVTPARRKACALLALLLTARGRPVSRDRVAALLWSQRGEDQARGSLRQTLYAMRALVSGPAPIVILDRTQARIAMDRIVTDLDRLRDAAASFDVGSLVATVGDPPQPPLADLDGIDPAFDEWLTIERARVDDERRRLLLATGDRALATRNEVDARRIALLLLEADSADEAAARLAMAACHRLDDRDGVRRIFGRLTEALRRQLGASPSDETIAVHRRATAPATARPVDGSERSKGAESLSDQGSGRPSRELAVPIVAAVDAEAEAAPVPSIGSTARPWRRTAAALSALVAIAIAVLWSRTPPGIDRRALQVEPLGISTGDGVALALNTGLSGQIARMIVGHDTTLHVDDASEATTDTTRFFVEGTAQSEGTRLHASISLLQRRGGPILWSQNLSGPIDDVDALRERIASAVAGVAICALGDETPRIRSFDHETLRLLLAACEPNQDHVDEAMAMLQKVVTVQPDFAHGWAMLAATTAMNAWRVGNDDGATRDAIEHDASRALALDPRQADAWFARAVALPRREDWSQRVALLEQASPADGLVLATLADQFSGIGRLHDAILLSHQAAEADPFSVEAALEQARLTGFSMGGGPDADHLFQAALRRFPTDPELALAAFRFAALVGDAGRAAKIVADPHRGFNLQTDRAAFWAALIRSRIGPSDATRHAAYDALTASMAIHPNLSLDTVEKLTVLGHLDEAFAFADGLASDALRDDDPAVLFSVVTAPLRADPRFMTLAAKFGLVAIWQESDRWPDFCLDHSVPYDCRIEAARARSSASRPLVGR